MMGRHGPYMSRTQTSPSEATNLRKTRFLRLAVTPTDDVTDGSWEKRTSFVIIMDHTPRII